MHKGDIDGENTGADANQVDDLPSGRRLGSVIPFRKAGPPPRSGFAAGGDPSPPAFIPLGTAVSAVVLRVENIRLRVRSVPAAEREGDDGRDV